MERKGYRTQKAAAEELGVSQSQVSRYYNAIHPVPLVVERVFRSVLKRRRSARRGR